MEKKLPQNFSFIPNGGFKSPPQSWHHTLYHKTLLKCSIDNSFKSNSFSVVRIQNFFFKEKNSEVIHTAYFSPTKISFLFFFFNETTFIENFWISSMHHSFFHILIFFFFFFSFFFFFFFIFFWGEGSVGARGRSRLQSLKMDFYLPVK